MARAVFLKLLAVAAFIAVTGCSYDVDINGNDLDPDLTATSDYDGIRKAPDFEWYEIAQGWNDEIRKAYWFTPQGSALIPYDWFVNLEMPERNCVGRPDPALNAGSWELFREAGHLRSLGYIPAPPDPIYNPDGLPIGFAKSTTAEGDFLGPTCAACHSNLMTLNGRDVLVEGAPTLADLEGLNQGLANALCSMDHGKVKSRAANREENIAQAKAQFERFARRVLGADYSPNAAENLFERVQLQTKRIQIRNARNYSKKEPRYGKGRLDAIGAILNEAAAWIAIAPENAAPANAPVSYPFLWGTTQLDNVQWTGFAANAGIGFAPLGRNVGEVVGVYGHISAFSTAEIAEQLERNKERAVELAPPLINDSAKGQFGGYVTSVNMPNLGAIEHWISLLRSPKWPEDVLGPLDKDKVALGRKIYMGDGARGVKCVGCHALVAREDQDKPQRTHLVRVEEIKTDPRTANNFLLEAHPTSGKPWSSGRFKGERKFPVIGEKYGDTFNNRPQVLVTIVANTIFGNALFDGVDGMLRSRSNADEEKIPNEEDKLFRYKARPLTGIWATAPYLHNGSVPNLMELLSPEGERSKKFCVGNRTFDPEKVGFVSALGPDGNCPDDGSNSTLLDTRLAGSWNTGHSSRRHGKYLSDAEREALIEFLKTL